MLSKLIFVILGFILLVFLIINNKNNSPEKRDYPNITINSANFKISVANTYAEQVKGLSGRTSMQNDAGMLFIFDKPGHYGFWMYGMKFPLDIILILNNKVVALHENLPPAPAGNTSPPIWGSEVLADKALEINAGLAKKYGIKVGDTVEIHL